MKILQVNCVYKTGSTGKIMADLHTEYQKCGLESVVCYGRGAVVREPGVYKTCGELYSKWNNLMTRFTGLMYGGCRISTHKLCAMIKKERPDIVHLHCINGYFVNIYRLIGWLKEHGIKTVLTQHAEFIYTANCGHALDCEKWRTGCGHCPRRKAETKSLFLDGTARSWRKMRAALSGFEAHCVVTSVSPWLMERAQQSEILKNFRHETVCNGVDTEIFRHRAADGIRARNGIGDGKLIVHVTAAFSTNPDHIKGGWYVAELAKRMPDITFAVIGRCAGDPKLPENVRYVGRVEDQDELAAWYSAADAALLTSRRETFSMVVAESLCCGTPVVGFEAGAPERIALPEYSTFVPYGDIAALEAALREQLAHPYAACAVADRAREIYSRETMCKGYQRIYGDLF